MCDILKEICFLLHRTQVSNGPRFRATPFLVRRVLEKELNVWWDVASGGSSGAGFTNRLMCLMQLARDDRIEMDLEAAEGIYSAWRTLSRACHYNAYDWTPAVFELESWIGQVKPLLEFLRNHHDDDTKEE